MIAPLMIMSIKCCPGHDNRYAKCFENKGKVPMDYTGLIAVITGAGSGIGEAVAYRLAQNDVRVVLVGRTAAKLETVSDAIRSAGGIASPVPCDVADPDQVECLREHVFDRFGPAQILFNGAGLHCELVSIGETTPAQWIETFQTNTVGPYLTCRAFLSGMIEAGWGRIINVSSAAAVGEPGHVGAVYQLSKVTLNWFTRQLAVEIAGSGVTANAIHPGEVKTEMWAAIKRDASSRTGAGRSAMGWVDLVEKTGGDPPEKTADLVMRLLRPESNGTNGQFLWIEGGIQEPRPAW
jgi:3-oxoacyl-[acyl-carrier protein] reductase